MAEGFREKEDSVNGVLEVRDELTWEEFVDRELRQFRRDHKQYLWRGQECSRWPLEPSLYREARRPHSNVGADESAQQKLLRTFKRATRGRRPVGLNDARNVKARDWWAYGRLHELWTPLLDWTESPFVALYFAFLNASQGRQDSDDSRSIWALSAGAVSEANARIEPDREQLDASPDSMPIFSPDFESQKLIRQRGWFTWTKPACKTVDDWIESTHGGETRKRRLIKWIIRDRGREDCLCVLNMMGVNHLSLFPDMYGVSRFLNLKSSIRNYDSIAELLGETD